MIWYLTQGDTLCALNKNFENFWQSTSWAVEEASRGDERHSSVSCYKIYVSPQLQVLLEVGDLWKFIALFLCLLHYIVLLFCSKQMVAQCSSRVVTQHPSY